MEHSEEKQAETLAAIDKAAGDLGLSAMQGMVWVTGMDGDELIDCTAADPRKLCDYLTAAIWRRAFKAGEASAKARIRDAIGE